MLFTRLSRLTRRRARSSSDHRTNRNDRKGRFTIRLEFLEARTLLSLARPGFAEPAHLLYRTNDHAAPLSTAGPTGYQPLQLSHAYGFDQIKFNNNQLLGSGTTIAIVDAYEDPNIFNDLHQFDLAFNLPDPPSFIKMNQSGGTTTFPAADAGWITEVALDVQWAHAMAPGASILLVEANDDSLFNLYTAVDTARSASGVVAVSMSWGSGEFSGERFYDGLFTTPSGHNGVTFLASSGDSGAPASYLSASRNVVSVGGTTLNLSGNNYLSETGWSGSGGGLSSYESQPAYQRGGVTQSTTRRATPDVAYDSNPATGFPVYDSYNNGTVTPWGQWGGTSDAAPQWAALIAIADQGRLLAGLGTLDGATQTLPMLYSMPASNFHDITTGTSTGSPHLSAGAGYDLVTGRGTPFANLVVNSLVGPISPSTLALVSGSDTGISNTDNLTNLNNGSASATLQFLVGGTVPGATVTLYSDGTAIGSAVASDISTTITTNGTFALGDGMHNITARQTEPGKSQSASSAAVAVTIDTTAPTVTDVVDVTPDPRMNSVSTVDVVFSEPIDLSTFTFADLILTRDGSPFALTSAVTASLVSGTTYRISGLDAFTAAAGAYVLTVSSTGIQDLAGNFGNGSGSDTGLVHTTTNQPPALGAIADQTMPVYPATQAVTLPGSDPDGDPLTYTAQALTVPSWLQRTYGLYVDPNGYYKSARGQQEIYFRGKVSFAGYATGVDPWYYIMPNGDFYEFTPPYEALPMTGVLVAHAGTAAYADPTLLTDAAPVAPPVALGVSGDVLTIAPGSGYAGTFVVIATVSDGQASASRSFNVTVQ